MNKRRILLLLTLAVWLVSAAALADTYTVLRYNDTGAAVQQLQTALKQLGYSVGSADGKYGPATEKAVRQFQQDYSLTVDGKAGQQTQALVYQLASGSSSSGSSSTTTTSSSYFSGNYDKLEYGSKGTRVTKLQEALNQLGFSAGKADGRYGTGTQQAVTAFQRAQGLSVDGKAGKQTLQRIEKVLAGEVTNVTPAPATPTATPNPYGTVPSRTLRKGYQGDDVKSVQSRLKTLKYYSGSVDGKYGTGTMAAVSAFQAANGLHADGLAGTATYKILYSDAAVPYSETVVTPTPASTVPSRTLRSGDSGDDVKNVQTRLKALGYYTGTVDGKYGSGTVAAIVTFQTQDGLKADGAAGSGTYKVLYSSSAKNASDTSSSGSSATATAPDKSKIKLMHWYNEVKPILKGKSSIYVYDPETKIGFTLHLYSLGRHADVEPMTADDTAKMMEAFGGVATWTPKFVYVLLPDGQWTVATMHNVAHGGQSIKDNNFDGQNCVHFLRDMDECAAADPKYGVTNQQVLRAGWKALTGETVN